MMEQTFFDIENIKVYDLSHEAALKFSGEMKKFVNGRISGYSKRSCGSWRREVAS